MAKRTSSKKASKHYPVQRKIRMGVALPAPAHTEMLIRTDKLASNVNHRLMRQSRIYRLKVDIDTNLPTGSVVEVYALADTWYNHKAYNKAKAVFDENSKEEREQLGSNNARWNDFRVNAEPAGSFTELKAVQFTSGAASALFTQGEYELSEVTDAAGATKTFSWDTTGGSIFNIIDEYDNMGNTQYGPTFPTTQVGYDGLTDELDDGQMAHLSDDGNIPPYSHNQLENQCWVKVGTLYVTNDRVTLSTGYFDAPCGLVRLSTGGGLELNGLSENICIELKSGDYKGVHAPSYLE